MSVLKGKGVVDGIGMAKVLRLDEDFSTPLAAYTPETPEIESSRYQQAKDGAIKQIELMVAHAKESGHQTQAEVLEAHLMMVSDVALEDSVQSKINEGQNAANAVKNASDEMSEMLAAIDDPYLQERSADVKDIGKRLLRLILGMPEITIDDGYHILVGADIDPSLVAKMTDKNVAGLLLGQGSTTSHAVIIAKTKGIPTVVGLGDQYKLLENDMTLIVDGENGVINTAPDEEAILRFKDRQATYKAMQKIYENIRGDLGMTLNGQHIPLAINVGNPDDIDQMENYGAEGVGLFRTEFVFMGKSSAPTEEEQFESYKYVAEKCGHHLCVIRTMDIGGDKPADYLEIGEEENPFLGWRALRISLDKPELFKSQIRAILRASAYGNVAVMLPMVISLSEIREAKSHIEAVKLSLKKEGIAFNDEIQIGIMIETPAAVLQADRFAKEVDFFSVGTNDLTQYILAVDRGNPRISNRYDGFHPAVLSAINTVSKAAKNAGIWIGMCGEMAGDVMALPLLIAMGFDELSMSAPSVPKVKHLMKHLKPDEKLLETVLAFDTPELVRDHLKQYLKDKA